MARALFLFIDGVGLGPDDPGRNPLAAARLPTFSALLAGRAPVAREAPVHTARASLVALDATLGVPGLPQSGTGHAALLTGENAPRLFGRHFGPWVPTALRGLVAESNVLVRAAGAGRSVAFANAFPEEILAAGDASRRAPVLMRTGPFLAARAAGVLTRHTPELMRGDAVASELVNEAWRLQLGRTDLPAIAAEQAGRNLARIASSHDLTLFAHYATDTAGHTGHLLSAIAAIERVDAFLGGVLAELPPDVLLLIASDHGNLEDVRAGHTLNPALGLVAGPSHAEIASGLLSLMDVTPAILRALQS